MTGLEEHWRSVVGLLVPVAVGLWQRRRLTGVVPALVELVRAEARLKDCQQENQYLRTRYDALLTDVNRTAHIAERAASGTGPGDGSAAVSGSTPSPPTTPPPTS